MHIRWGAGIGVALLLCCLLWAGGTIGLGTSSGWLQRALPIQLLNLGPVWVGDFCRYNEAQDHFPSGWCPRGYTLSLVVQLRERGAIYPLLRLPADELKPLGP
jgi:hypothetical protein